MKSEIYAFKSEFEKDTTDSQVTRQILSYSLPLFHPAITQRWSLLGTLPCWPGITYMIFTLLPACKFQFPSLILSFVADHLLWPLLPVCATSRKLRRFSPIAFLPSPTSVSSTNTRDTLFLETHWWPENQFLWGIRSLWQTCFPPSYGPSQHPHILDHPNSCVSAWELQWSHIRYSEAFSTRQPTSSTCS